MENLAGWNTFGGRERTNLAELAGRWQQNRLKSWLLRCWSLLGAGGCAFIGWNMPPQSTGWFTFLVHKDEVKSWQRQFEKSMDVANAQHCNLNVLKPPTYQLMLDSLQPFSQPHSWHQYDDCSCAFSIFLVHKEKKIKIIFERNAGIETLQKIKGIHIAHIHRNL